jgi:uncharacterized protein (DUF697 family)
MNKKNLPKAIRPPETGPVHTASSRPAPEPAAPFHHEPLKPATTMAQSGPAALSAAHRRAVATKVVERFTVWSGAAGFIPLPLLDLALIGGMQIEMLRRISQIYDVPFSQNLGKALIAGLGGSMIPATSGAGMMSVLKGIPLAGTAISFFAQPAMASGASYAIGMAFIEHFESGGTLLDFKPAHYRAFIRSARNSGV